LLISLYNNNTSLINTKTEDYQVSKVIELIKLNEKAFRNLGSVFIVVQF